MIWHLLCKRQIMWEIVSNFVAFLENLNFNNVIGLMYLPKIVGTKLKVPICSYPPEFPVEYKEALHCDHDGMLLECIRSHLG